MVDSFAELFLAITAIPKIKIPRTTANTTPLLLFLAAVRLVPYELADDPERDAGVVEIVETDLERSGTAGTLYEELRLADFLLTRFAVDLRETELRETFRADFFAADFFADFFAATLTPFFLLIRFT